MLINKAYGFRIYPNEEQKIFINKCIGSSRFVYNYYLNKKEELYKNNIYLSLKDMKKDLLLLAIEYPWLKEVDSCAIRTSLEDLDRAYINFYKGSGHPKFKKKNSNDTYRTNCIRNTYKDKNYSNIKVDLINREITLPKIGKVKMRGYRNLTDFPFKIFNATISKVANKYYVSLSVEEHINIKPFVPKYITGIDLGVKDLVITSDGIKYKALENIKKFERKIKGYNKALARSKKNSNNRKKIIVKLQRYYEKLRNARKFYTNLITTNLVKENDIIVCESLKVKEMIEKEKHHLAKYISNSSFGEILRQLEYKCLWNNKKLIKINTYYPSSQICSVCGNRKKELKNLSIRSFVCDKCKNELDRDVNASINILMEGIRKYIKQMS